MGMSQKVFKERMHTPSLMGEKTPVTILGNIVTYRNRTDLETVADETARSMGVMLSNTNDDMQPGSWMYCYSKEGKADNKEINYNLYCFAEQEGADIPVDQAIETVKKKMAAGEFSEELWAFDGQKRLFVHQDPKLVEPGKYLATENGKALGGDWDIKKIRILISQIF
ncbi:hypothetical protein KY338_05040 [Candidatus Woesearchaeota archaeon]|nr:hypothetical protein [Candidatus Woesearchaeota archaeon]MBW3006480.1 hypothetical protein [Candidatus Woesearchaeota archaeon]